MKAMALNAICSLAENQTPLRPVDLPDPSPEEDEIIVKISACGVCHTELDEIEGRTPPTRFPIVPGHQAVGTVVKSGSRANRFSVGERVGVGWIYSACGHCQNCRSGNENLCDDFIATGRDANGGYAEFMRVKDAFAHKIPDFFSDMEAAPLLCAGAIGYRSLRLSGIKNGQSLGLTGFGASAHLVVKLVRHQYPATKIYVFARSKRERQFAETLGAVWVGDTDETAPEKLDSMIDTTPVWKPVVEALRNLKSGGRLIINAIRKEDADKNYLSNLNYATHLWLEKEIKSVANVTRKDIGEFLTLAAAAQIRPEVQLFDLKEANTALIELKQKMIRGAKVLKI